MSKKAFKQARHSIFNFVKYNVRGKSYSTYASIRERMINSIKNLHELGYPIRNINNLQKKHVDVLVTSWLERNLSTGTIKNRMSDIRLWAKVAGKTHISEQTNKDYGIPNRSYIPTQNKAITDIDLNKFEDKYLKACIDLQKEFGLRREECLKIKPSEALKTTSSGKQYIELKSSWTKGGVGRRVPITNDSQLNAINHAKDLAGNGFLINKGSYIKAQRYYDKVTREQGYYNLHGLRHAYAQKRYNEITGWASPIAGGPVRKDLTKEQKILDKQARIWISQELGHSRASITKNYIG